MKLLDFAFGKKAKIFLAAILICLLLSAVWAGVILNQKSFYDGIYVDGVNVSGMSMKDALNAISAKLDSEHKESKIVLKYSSKNWTLSLDDISHKFHADEALNEAFDVGRKGNVFIRIYDIISTRLNKRNFNCFNSFNRDFARKYLMGIKKQIDKDERNTEILFNKGTISFNNEVIGKSMDIDINLNLLENNVLKRNFEPFEIYVEEKIPKVVYNDIKDINNVLAVFSTAFNPADSDRNHNIKLASDRINGTILLNNEIFSMNRALGPRTLENGYKEAPVIFKNELVKGTGGGVCQVTSTLYNSVLLSKLNVIERTHHSWPLGYVGPGRDATIAEDYIDFKFENNYGYPVSISSEVVGNTLRIRILGRKDDRGYTVKLKSEVLEEVEPGAEELVVDNSVPDDGRVVQREAHKGIKVVLYRETYNKNGELLDKEKISEDVYKPVNAQIKVNQNTYNKLKGI